MAWTVITRERFDQWLIEQTDDVRLEILAAMSILEQSGPMLGRPYADQITASRFNNMKELRVQVGGDPYRAFFAFDQERQAVVLCAGNKCGNEKRFYKDMIPIADAEFKAHNDDLERKSQEE